MIESLYYDTFANEYTLNKDYFAPPERYIKTYRGEKDYYIECWNCESNDGKSRINVTFYREEYCDPMMHKIKLESAQKQHDCSLTSLNSWTIPDDIFDKYVEQFCLSAPD